MDIKEQIKRDISIVDVASLYVDLKPAGKNYKALCPFHTEKTPSFFVMPEKESFACYGCNKFGDIFSLAQEMENLTFPEAINFLIDKFNLNIQKKEFKQGKKRDIYLETNQLAQRFFLEQLFETAEGKRAMDYLKSRGIPSQAVDTFNLGYSPNKWDGLHHYLQKEGQDLSIAIELGLLISAKNKTYDRFRGRIMFPIYSENGKLLAFGGRTLFDDPAKYLNSPDNPIYKKSNHLYGFQLTKQHIRDQNGVVIVEGYFDMISLYQNGVKNVVASLGTALTERQIYTLKRFSKDIYIFYDNDQAGIQAALRGVERMFEQNIVPRIIRLSEKGDPDDFIRSQGLKIFNERLADAQSGLRFIIDEAEKLYDMRTPEGKSKASHFIMGLVERFTDPILKEEYTQVVADMLRLDVAVVRRRRKEPLLDKGENNTIILSPAERIFLESLLARPEFIDQMRDLINEDILSVLKSRNLVNSILKHYNPQLDRTDNFKKIAESLTTQEKNILREMFEATLKNQKDRTQIEDDLTATFLKFQDSFNKKRSQEINQKIRLAEKNNQRDIIIQLMTQKNKYVKQKLKQLQEE
jgi:DNA primase